MTFSNLGSIEPRVQGIRQNLHSTDKFHDEVVTAIVNSIDEVGEPLETKEVEGRVRILIPSVSRSKLFYRLQNLRAEGHIHGKFVGSGKGVWIWWKGAKHE